MLLDHTILKLSTTSTRGKRCEFHFWFGFQDVRFRIRCSIAKVSDSIAFDISLSHIYVSVAA